MTGHLVMIAGAGVGAERVRRDAISARSDRANNVAANPIAGQADLARGNRAMDNVRRTGVETGFAATNLSANGADLNRCQKSG